MTKHEKELLDAINKLSTKIGGMNTGGSNSYSSSSGRNKNSYTNAPSDPSRGMSRNFDKLKEKGGDLFSNLRLDSTVFYEEMVNMYGGLVDFQNSNFENAASMTIKTQMSQFEKMMFDTKAFVGNKNLFSIFGSTEAVYEEMKSIYDVNSFYLNKIAEDYADTDAGTRLIGDAITLKEVLRIETSDFNKIIEKEFTGSGKVTIDVLKDIAYYSDVYADQTSANVFQITNSMTAAIADFDTFGAASNASIGKLSGYLGELGMSTGNITGLVTKMQSFEGASGIARDLGGAFGAILDPMALMKASFEDPAEALNMVRDAMLDAGMSTEEMGHQSVFLGKMLNMSTHDVRRFMTDGKDMNKLLADSNKEYENTTKNQHEAIAKREVQMTDTRSMYDLAMEAGSIQTGARLAPMFRTLTEYKTSLNQFITQSAEHLNDLDGTDVTEFTEQIQKAAEAVLLESDSTKRQANIDALFANFGKGMNEAARKSMQTSFDQVMAIDPEKVKEALAAQVSNKGITLYDPVQTEADIEATWLAVTNSEGMLKYHTAMRKQNYYSTNSNSKFHKDVILNFNKMTKDPVLLNTMKKFAKTMVPDELFKLDAKVRYVVSVSDEEISRSIEKIRNAKSSTNGNDAVIARVDNLIQALKEIKIPITIENNMEGSLVLDGIEVGRLKEVIGSRDNGGNRFATMLDLLNNGSNV